MSKYLENLEKFHITAHDYIVIDQFYSDEYMVAKYTLLAKNDFINVAPGPDFWKETIDIKVLADHVNGVSHIIYARVGIPFLDISVTMTNGLVQVKAKISSTATSISTTGFITGTKSYVESL